MTDSDSTWLAGAFDAHGLAIRAFAARRVGADLVDDVVAEAFTRLWRRGSPPDNLLPWLYRTSAHVIAQYYRSEARRHRNERRAAAMGGNPTLDLVTDQVMIERALAVLPTADAEVLKLRYWEDLSLADLAIVLGISLGAAKVRLHRARRRLLTVLEPEHHGSLTLITTENS